MNVTFLHKSALTENQYIKLITTGLIVVQRKGRGQAREGGKYEKRSKKARCSRTPYSLDESESY